MQFAWCLRCCLRAVPAVIPVKFARQTCTSLASWFVPQLEPQFSSKVQELMKLEEAAGKKAQFDRQQKLGQKVDAQVRRQLLCHTLVLAADFMRPWPALRRPQMKQECRSALKYIIDLHAKQRMKLYHKQIAERDALFKRINDDIDNASKYVPHFNACVRVQPCRELWRVPRARGKAVGVSVSR